MEAILSSETLIVLYSDTRRGNPEDCSLHSHRYETNKFFFNPILFDRLCGLVVRVLGYRSGRTGSIPVTTIKK
jgi:hypothetical protein